MHEMSLVQSMLEILADEKVKHGIQRLKRVTVVNGALANVVTDALNFAWETLTPGTEFDGVELVINEKPLRVACGGCGTEFSPEDNLYMPCPDCGLEIGHKVLEGRELYIGSIEAEDSQTE